MMPPSRLFAVLDPARGKPLGPLLDLAGQAAVCLYEGPLDPTLKAACPHLICLDREPTLRHLWFSEGWGDAWGLMLGSSLETAGLRRRLRHFTLARLPDGEGPMLFRFWDPRVFRVYLPSCLPEELAPWFQGIDWWAAEADQDDGLIRYTLADSGLSVTAHGRPS